MKNGAKFLLWPLTNIIASLANSFTTLSDLILHRKQICKAREL